MKALCAVPCLLSSVASLTRSLFFRELVFQRKSNLWHFFSSDSKVCRMRGHTVLYTLERFVLGSETEFFI